MDNLNQTQIAHRTSNVSLAVERRASYFPMQKRLKAVGWDKIRGARSRVGERRTTIASIILDHYDPKLAAVIPSPYATADELPQGQPVPSRVA